MSQSLSKCGEREREAKRCRGFGLSACRSFPEDSTTYEGVEEELCCESVEELLHVVDHPAFSGFKRATTSVEVTMAPRGCWKRKLLRDRLVDVGRDGE